MEATQQNTEIMKGKTDATISKVTHEHKPTNNLEKVEQHWKKPCYHCGRHGHAPSDRSFKDNQCHK